MVPRSRRAIWPLAALTASLLVQPVSSARAELPKHLAPIPSATLALMAARGTSAASPILMRAYKKEGEIEVWKQGRDGRYVHLKTFPICRWSGQLGPKTRQGDRQTPEGFYSVGPGQMNPNSSYYLSFDIGYPNAYDRAHGGTGSYLMVHGTCSSAGCFAMTDKAVAEIYALAREAFAGGQRAFQFQSYPFRMTAQNLARHRADPHIGFWRQLKEGSDRFEATGREPVVTVSAGRYVFTPLSDPAREALASARVAEEQARIASLVADGVASVRTTYVDGGQHASFASLIRRGEPVGAVSRPETLAFAGREVVLTPARPKRPGCEGTACPVQTAGAAPAAKPALSAQAVAPTSRIPTPLLPPEAEAAVLASKPARAGPAQPMLASLIKGAEPILPALLTDRAFAVAQR